MSERCSSCDGAIQTGHAFCTSCGAPASGGATIGRPAPALPPAVGAPPVACAVCGRALGATNRFCTSCGSTRPGLVPPDVPVGPSAAGPVDIGSPGAWQPPPAEEPAGPPGAPIRPIPIEPLVPAGRPPRRWRPVALGVGLAVAVLAGGLVAVTQLSGFDLPVIGGPADDEATASGAGETTIPTAPDPSSTATTPPTTVTTTATTRSTTTSVGPTSTSTSVDDVVEGISCSSGGPALRGRVTGVAEWVTMRAGPALTALELIQVPNQAELVYFPESTVQGERFRWIETSFGGSCGWVASKFVKDGDGRVVGAFDAIDYVHRALRGLEPEALYASVEYDGPLESATELPVDRAGLEAASQELRSLYLSLGSVDTAPDPSIDEIPDLLGCSRGDYLHCQVLLTDAAGRSVGRVSVSFVGDGVTSVFVEPG